MIRVLPLLLFAIIIIFLTVQYFLVPLYKKYCKRENEIKKELKKVEKINNK